MTTTKKNFADIIKELEIIVMEAPAGQRWTKYPSGQPIAPGVKAKFIITVGNRFYAGSTLEVLIIKAHREGKINLHDHGYDNCHRCSGTGKLSHYAHINEGNCFKCNGFGLV